MKRAKWKGFFLGPENHKNLKRQSPDIISRNSLVVPKFLDKTFKIYNGKQYKKIKISKEMLGHKFGEFFKTRVAFEYKKKKKKK